MHRVNFKLDLVPLPPRLLQNRDIHIDYHRHTQEQANTLQELVEQAKVKQPLDKELDFAKDWKDKKKQKRSKTDKKREKDKETKSKSENSARDHSRISPTQSKIEIKKVKESR
ncbi:hypothetical protein Tco_0104660 [Tanacetum coccineum]